MGEISAFYEDSFKTPECPCRTVTSPSGARPTVISTLQELAMNRTYYFVGGLAALMFVVLVQSVGVINQPAASVPSQSVAANPTITPAPVPDAGSVAIEDLASWPIAATR
jgi:hypothetical protein